jgi:hypothetical protein
MIGAPAATDETAVRMFVSPRGGCYTLTISFAEGETCAILRISGARIEEV